MLYLLFIVQIKSIQLSNIYLFSEALISFFNIITDLLF